MLDEWIDDRIRWWWPYLGVAIVCGLLAGVVYSVWSNTEVTDHKVESVPAGFGSMEELTSLPKFRLAYLKANGGEESLAALQSVRASGVMESEGNTVPFFTMKRRPDMSLTTLKMPDYDLTFGVDGDVVWQRVTAEGQEPQYTLNSGEEAEALGETGAFFDPIMGVLLFDQGTIERLSPSQWMGKDAMKIEFYSEESSIRAAAYVDIRTMQPLARIEKFSDGRVRKVLYGDYRTVGGMMEPFEIKKYVDDILQVRIVIDKSDANVGAILSLFKYPEHLPDAPTGARSESGN